MKQRPFEEPAWVEATRDLDFSPLSPIRETQRRERRNQNKRRDGEAEMERNPPVHIDRPLLTSIVKFVIILIAATAIALLLKHFLGFGSIPWNKKIKPQQQAVIQLETIEENLHEAELNQLIRQAVERGQYALAVRLYFLAILRELSLLQAIRWKKNKTNREYLQELKNQSDYVDFRQTARIFERIWYGDRSVSAADFQRLETPFSDFLRRLQRRNEEEK